MDEMRDGPGAMARAMHRRNCVQSKGKWHGVAFFLDCARRTKNARPQPISIPNKVIKYT